MDNIIAESETTMINSLNFGLPETAQYITDRRHVNYFPSGSNVYNPKAGNKQIRFHISGEDNTYIDLSSIRLFANLQNTDGTRSHFLRPLGNLSSFFSRYRCTVGGQQVQDIIEYNRHCELYNSFKSQDARDMDDLEGGANPRWDDDWRHTYATGLAEFLDVNTRTNPTATPEEVSFPTTKDHNNWGDLTARYTRHSVAGIPGANGYMRLGHKPVCGLLESNYYLPLRYAPLELEFTIVSDEHAPVIAPFTVTDANTQNDANGYYFTTGDTSTLWELNNVIIRAEVIQLDNTVNNNIVKHLLEGQSLKLVFPMYHTMTQSFNAAGTEINMNIVKSASKLNGCFITLYRPPRAGVDADNNNYYRHDNYIYKRWNYFYNPMINSRIFDGLNPDAVDGDGNLTRAQFRGKGFQNSELDLTWQLQINNKKYPEFECQSMAETAYYLKRALHYLNPDQDAFSISYKRFREDKFVIGISFEKMQDTNFTGQNTKQGGLLVFKLKGSNKSFTTDEDVRELFVHMISESVLELRESGSLLYD